MFNNVKVFYCWGIHQVAQFANCRLRCRLSSGWESETRYCELIIFEITKGTKPMVPARWVDTGRHRRSAGLRRMSQTCWRLNCEGIKTQGFHPRRQQLKQFLCYSAVTKWLYGRRPLRLSYGKPGVKSVGNLSERGMSGDKWGTRRLTGAACCEGTWVPADKVSGIGTVRVSWMVRLESLLINS